MIAESDQVRGGIATRAMCELSKFASLALIIFATACLFLANRPASASTDHEFVRMWPTIPQPWQFDTGKDIAEDTNGNLYILISRGFVQKFTKDGQFIMRFTQNGTFNIFTNARGIAVDLDGMIYVADSPRHRVQKYSPEGVWLANWGLDPEGFGQAGSGPGEFTYPSGLAVSPAGLILVADAGNNRVQAMSPDGVFQFEWGSYGTGQGQFDMIKVAPEPNPHWYYMADIACDPFGIVYVTDTYNHRVQVFQSGDGTFEREWGIQGSGDGEFLYPGGITVHDEGADVYVADNGNNRIQLMTAFGDFVAEIGGPAYEPNQISYGPIGGGLYVDPSRTLFAVDPYSRSIKKYGPPPDYVQIANWQDWGNAPGTFHAVMGIAVDGAGNVYTAERGTSRVQKFNADGQYLLEWGQSDAGWGTFSQPSGICIDGQGKVCVVDTDNSKVRYFDTGGTWVGEFGSAGSGNGQFQFTGAAGHGIAVDDTGALYVVDIGNDRVQKFTWNGNSYDYATQWGSQGSGDGEFEFGDQYGDLFGGVAVDDNADLVFVSDTMNHRIQKFQFDGTYVGQLGTVGFGLGEIYAPSGIAVDSTGRVYVLENLRLQAFDADGSNPVIVAEAGFGPGQVWANLCHLAITPAGLIYVADIGNSRVVKLRQVAQAASSKAVVVAAGGPFPGNNLWNATQLCANFAYRTLTYQGFSKERIQYLSSDLDLDIDGNGQADDVDADATNANLQDAITNWAAAGSTEDVVVYLVDHGGVENFRMSGTETLDAADLDTWLDTLEASISGTLTVIYDACESGTFQTALAPGGVQQRILLTSTSAGESAYFLSQGSVSFSMFFWTHIFNGATVLDAFNLASQGMDQTLVQQTPVLADSPGDESLAGATYIGNGTEIVGDAPVIGGQSAPQAIVGTSTATLFADPVTDADGVGRLWAVLQPPNYVPASTTNPIQDLPAFDLQPQGNDRFEASYSGFNEPGIYQVALYARDVLGNTSAPVLTTLSVDSPLRRKAVIVVGGDATHPQWSAFENAAQRAYDALKQQQYTDGDIAFRSPVSFNAGVDGAPSLSGIQYYLTAWGTFDTYDLVLYLVGPASGGNFELGTGEFLDPVTLDGWLDILQTTIPGIVTVVIDANQSASFVPDLLPPDGKQRIVSASAGSVETARFGADGNVSFSAYFWNQVLNGVNVRNAFKYAQNSMRFSGGGQMAVINDNGNAVGNEKIDGLVAKNYAIGAGIQLAGDAPVIGSIGATPDTLAVSTSSTIWVEGVTSTGTIDAVTATVLPPGHEAGDPLPEFSLAYVSGSRYEGSYAGFDRFGAYEVAVVARDSEGQTSAPLTVTVTQTDAADVYEPDDSSGAAGWFDLDGVAQTHNFHADANEDWVKFFAHAGDVVSVETFDLGIASDTYLTIYQGSGLTFVGEDDDGSPTETWGSYYEFAAVATDYYYVKVHFPENPSFPQRYGPDTEYSLRIFRPIGPCLESGTLDVYVHSGSLSGPGVTGATVTLTELANPGFPQEKFSGVGGEVLFGFSAEGSHEIQVSKAGYTSPSPLTQLLSCVDRAEMDVVLQPQAGVDPVLQVTPGGWEFGSVAVGNQVEKAFSVTNAGGGTLAGSVSTASPFSVVSGGSYSLGAGQNQSVTMRFTPGAAQGYNGQASFTGGGGATVALSGTGFSGATGVIGDVNADESIDALDATLINLYIVLGYDLETINAQLLSVGLNPMLPSLADVDRTGGTTSRDATLISVELLMGKGALNGYLSTRNPALPISHAGEPLP